MLVPRRPPGSAFGWRFWPSVLSIWGPGGLSDAHAHHAIQIMVARSGTLEAKLDAASPPQRVAGLMTGADALHGIDARGRQIVLVFVEPESEGGARITARLTKSGVEALALTDAERRRLVDVVDAAADPESAARRIVDVLATDRGGPPSRPVHPGVRRVLRHLERAAPGADTSVAALARIASLSHSRFVHAFTESVGISLKAYLLWRKVQSAALGLQTPATLAMVAQQAGFVDAAHMTRTFRRTFGVTPSVLRGFVELSGKS